MTKNSTENNKSIFDAIEAEHHKRGKFIKLQSGEKRVFQFLVEPENEKIRLVDREYTDKSTGTVTTSKRVQYCVIDPKSPDSEKILELPLRASSQLNALLRKGMTTVEVQRQGSGTSTSYVFIPV
ncbi:MAG: hypothetical protein HRF40_06845 [Nitrososphaera sp.]|jgi:hypothetical protein